MLLLPNHYSWARVIDRLDQSFYLLCYHSSFPVCDNGYITAVD